MKKILCLFLTYPLFGFGQTNSIYSLLNWNTSEQQKGLIAWYDLQDQSVVKLADNQKIFMIQDKSIWKNNITQPTSSLQPLLIKDSKLNTSSIVNGISFSNGGFMKLMFPSIKNVQAITSFVICKNSIGGSMLMYDLSLEGGEGVASCYSGLDKIETRVPNSSAAFQPTFGANPEQYLFIATKGSAGNVLAYLNDSQYAGQGYRNFNGGQYNRIRLSTEQGDAPTNGTLYELILFDRELNIEEFSKVKNYLVQKYKIENITNNYNIVSESKKRIYNTQFVKESLGSNQNFTIEQTTEALNLFFEGYTKRMTITSDVFDAMKLLVQRSYNQNSSKLSKKSSEQYMLLTGAKEGGPTTYGDDSGWRLGGSVSKESERFLINFNEVVSNFKVAIHDQSAPDCEECEIIVSKYYQTFQNKTEVPEAEFSNLKIQTQRCYDQRRQECKNKKMNAELSMLSGETAGGPTTYGDDSKWRLGSKTSRKQVKYDTIKPIDNGDFIVKYKNKLGVIDQMGYLFLPTMHDNIISYTFNSELIYVAKKNGKMGIYGASGQDLIAFEYDYIVGNKIQNNRFLAFKKNGKWGIINNDLSKASITNYENITYSGSWIIIKENNKTGFLNMDGDIAIEPKYDDVFVSIDNLFPSKNVLPVVLNNKIGLIDINLKEISPLIYDRVGYYGNDKNNGAKAGLIPVYLNNKVGYLNEQGKVLIEPKYDTINGFGLMGYGLEMVSYVKLAGKWGLLDNNTCKEITPIKYDELYGFSNKYLSAGFKEGGKFGLISIDGKELLPAKYEAVYNFWDNGLAAINLNGMFGLINTKGNIIVEPRFQSLDLLNTGLIQFKLNNKIGLLNPKGQELVSGKFDEILQKDNGIYPTRIGSKWGFLNDNGIEVVQPIYDYKVFFKDDIAVVQSNGISYKINTSGQRVINNFSNSSLTEITVDNNTIYNITSSRMEEVYKDALGKLMVGSMLGTASASNTLKQIENEKRNLLNNIKGWIGGTLTPNQLAEFNEITKNAEDNFNLTMSTISGALRSTAPTNNSNRQGSNTGKSVSKKCDYCGNRFSDNGYSIYINEIIAGKYKDPWVAQQAYGQVGGKGKIDNTGSYCTRKCAVDAYNSGARGK